MTEVEKIAKGLTEAQRRKTDKARHRVNDWSFFGYLFAFGFIYWFAFDDDDFRAGVCAILSVVSWGVADVLRSNLIAGGE